MKNFTFFLIVFFFLTLSFAQNTGKVNIAVLNLESSSLPTAEILALSDRLRAELFNTNQFEVLERNRMDEILKEQGFVQTGACRTDECVVQAGRMLQVQYVAAGSIEKVGKTFASQARIVEVESGKILLVANVDCDCPIETVLRQSMRDLAEKLAVPPGQHAIRLRKTGYETTENVAILTPGQSMPFHTTLVQAAVLQVNSDPSGATVFINNRTAGVTPVKVADLLPGKYLVKLTSTIYEELNEEVTLSAGATNVMNSALKIKTGAARITTTPAGVTVSIDGRPAGTTPVLVPNIAYGEHSALFTMTNFRSVEMPFNVNQSGPLLLQAELTMVMAKLSVTGRPVTAELVVDGQSFGSLPVLEKPLKPGDHRVQLKASGYEVMSYDVNFAPDETKSMNVYLQPKKRGKAVLRSVFIPGWGQMYGEKKVRAIAYPVLQVAAIGAGFWASSHYNKENDKYKVAQTDYNGAMSLADVDQTWKALGNKYQDVKTANDQRTIFIGLAAALWVWNILDAAVWPPEGSSVVMDKGAGLSRPELYCTEENRFVKIGLIFDLSNDSQ